VTDVNATQFILNRAGTGAAMDVYYRAEI